MPNVVRVISSLACLCTLSLAIVAETVAAPWIPLCPNGVACATTIAPLLAGGRLIVSSSTTTGPNYAIDPQTLSSSVTSAHAPSIWLGTGHTMSVSVSGGTVYDADGNTLYTFDHAGLGAAAAGLNAVDLGSTVALDRTEFATVVTGVQLASGPPRVYQSRDEGRSWTMQEANIAISPVFADGNVRIARTSFVSVPGSAGVWVVPGSATKGLWTTPARASASAPLDFTRLVRVDDGSFPVDVFRLRTFYRDDVADGAMFALAPDGMYVSNDVGRTWTRSTIEGMVDDIQSPRTSPFDGFDPIPDFLVVAARGTLSISRDQGGSWVPFANGLPYDRYALTLYHGGGTTRVFATGAGASYVCDGHGLPVNCDGPGFGRVQVLGSSFGRAVEFYHPALDHYFLTADETEKQAVRSGGAGTGWVETGESFWVWSPEWRQEAAYVCRFYGDPVKGPNSHFFSASTDECRGLLAAQDATVTGPKWTSEGYAFKVGLPGAAGSCAPGLIPVYRAYNNGFARGVDSNHRLVSRRDLLVPLFASGWIDEGVAFCVPASAN